ncbi:MAG: hypothetical protein JST93_07985 [Acidobacteria bacterium]|nr:hypothetical protein [Acidobacteriota bacterium]
MLLALAAVLLAADTNPAAPSAEEIMTKVEAADRQRKQSSKGHSSIRHYTVENKRLHFKAYMKVEAITDPAGARQFRIISVQAPAAVKKLVFQRMLDTEAKAYNKTQQSATDITRQNYTFRLEDTIVENGQKRFILAAEPRSNNSLLFRGRIWIDEATHAVVRISGSPSKNPSFWVRKTSFVHDYVGLNGQWLASSNISQSEIRIFGHSTVTIQYGDYTFPTPALATEGAGTH